MQQTVENIGVYVFFTSSSLRIQKMVILLHKKDRLMNIMVESRLLSREQF
jgi:hypothetical protein